MSTQMLLYVIYAVAGIFGAIVVAYLIISKKMQKSEYQKIKKLREGTKSNGFSFEILYQKLYIAYSKIPYVKSKVSKLRRRLEIINVDDEYGKVLAERINIPVSTNAFLLNPGRCLIGSSMKKVTSTLSASFNQSGISSTCFWKSSSKCLASQYAIAFCRSLHSCSSESSYK